MHVNTRLALDRVMRGGGHDADVDHLLSAFYEELSLNHLRDILRSENPKVVGSGAWILSELGRRGRPLLGECGHLLNHRERAVRFYAIDCVLVNATPDDGAMVSQCVEHLLDCESAVQWKCLDLLRRIDDMSLASAAQVKRHRWISENLEWVVKQLKHPDEGDIGKRADSTNFLDRAFAAVAGARLGSPFAPFLRRLGEKNGDAVAKFALNALEDMALPRGTQSRN